jgi:ferric-dicitrate binding protein FerR (iron transport regulator)
MARRKSVLSRQTQAARENNQRKRAAYERKKNQVEKLEGKKPTAKRQRELEEIKRREKIEGKRNKTQSILILCGCGLAALIMSNWQAISSFLGIAG